MIPKNELLTGSFVYNSDLEVIKWNENLLLDEHSFNPIEINASWLIRFGFETLDNIRFIKHPSNKQTNDFVIELSKSVGTLLTPEEGVTPLTYNATTITFKAVHQLQKLYHLRTGEFLELQEEK